MASKVRKALSHLQYDSIRAFFAALLYDSAYIAIATLTVLIPATMHSKAGCCTHHWLHVGSVNLVHSEDYNLKLEFSAFDANGRFEGQRKKLSNGEIWEGFALLQALLFSLILIIDVSPDKYSKILVFGIVCIVVFSFLALMSLLLEFTKAYQWLLGLNIFGFMLMDFILYTKTKRNYKKGSQGEFIIYRNLLLYVDVPVLLAISILYSYAGLPVLNARREFFSGAVAFQLIFGNFLIFLVRRENSPAYRIARWSGNYFRQSLVALKGRCLGELHNNRLLW